MTERVRSNWLRTGKGKQARQVWRKRNGCTGEIRGKRRRKHIRCWWSGHHGLVVLCPLPVRVGIMLVSFIGYERDLPTLPPSPVASHTSLWPTCLTTIDRLRKCVHSCDTTPDPQIKMEIHFRWMLRWHLVGFLPSVLFPTLISFALHLREATTTIRSALTFPSFPITFQFIRNSGNLSSSFLR